MALTETEIRKLHDKAFSHNQVTRERAADDMLFTVVTQWDDNLLGESSLQYRGEFNIIKKAISQTLADLHSSEVQVDFQPEDETREDAADFMDGVYRTSIRNNASKESFDNATQEQVICGLGGWRLYTEMKRNKSGENIQVIKREPIYEFNNNAFPDPNAKRLDKSDANYWSILIPYSEDGYAELVKELTGEDMDPGQVGESFAFPEQTYVFPWKAQDKKVYVARFYHRELKKKKLLVFQDLFGDTQVYDAKEVKDVEDELIDSGFQLVNETEKECYEVTEYIVGHEILSQTRIAGEYIPIVPEYGERVFVEGEEVYYGVTRDAKDPQRLRNFQLSYLADIVSRSPRVKPIYTPEQIQGFEDMYTETGADNNYPYMLMNSQDANGNPLPQGAITTTPEQTIPQALAASIDLSRQAVEDVANPGVPQDIADTDLSGKAVGMLQGRLDNQSFVFQNHHKYAMRYDALVFSSMAKEVIDTPRQVTMTLPDGTRKDVMAMTQVVDQESLEIVTLNDLTNAEFNVYSDIGKPYETVKQQNREEILSMIGLLDPTDPLRQMYILKYNVLMDGADFKDVREYARKQLVLMGFTEPETEEEMAMLMQAQQAQAQQEDPNMALAQAEILKGQAQLMDAETKQQESQIKMFDAQTKRQKVQIDAAEAGVNIENKQADTVGKQIDNAQKAYGGLMQRVNA